MAKYECSLCGNFDELLGIMDEEILEGSLSASYEDGSDYAVGDTRCAVRVYERYSVFGGNRVSMNLTLVGNGQDLFLSAITSGGSQGMFFKINTVGEETFLEQLEEIIDKYTQEA